MKYTAFALVLFATASTAHASGADSTSLLRCGVIFGGKSLTYDAGGESKSTQDQRFNAMPRTASADPLRFAPSAAAEREADATPAATSTSDKRLPRNLTLATVGCSW
jgi:hypothetical protein